MAMTTRRTGTLIDVDSAAVQRTADGYVIDDPASPLLVSLQITPARYARPRVRRLVIEVRHPDGRISEAALRRLPLRQIVNLCGATAPATAPNESHYRALARPKAAGARTWDNGHWGRVLAVHQWAETVGRPGGGTQAIADLWGVSRNPTAYRWLAYARRQHDDRDAP